MKIPLSHYRQVCTSTYNIAVILIVSCAAISLGGCEKGTDNTMVPQKTAVKNGDNRSVKSADRSVITIDLPGLPDDVIMLEMVAVKPGTFMMGSPKSDIDRNKHDWPIHEVTINRPYYIGKYEVTQAQWEAVMGKDSHHSKFRPKPNNPVEKVSWIYCQLFIRKMNKLGLGRFRLPSEAEWEYACRAGTDTIFSFGTMRHCEETEGGIMDSYIWWQGNNKPEGTKEVGTKMPNPWGLYDMHGNVWEWCSDRWVTPYDRGPFVDPQKPASPLSYILLLRNRVTKGGSFWDKANECRSVSRSFEQSIDFHYCMGLRLVREYP